MTTFTTTSPTAGGQPLPAGITEIGGLVLDLIGLNGVRIVSQVSASTLHEGYFSGSLGTIGTQSGFSPQVLSALGGGIAEAAIRVTLSDGDTAQGNFDFQRNHLIVNGVDFGDFSSVQTQVTSGNGQSVFGTTYGFPNNSLATGWFHVTTAESLNILFESLETDGLARFALSDTNPGDNFFNFKQGIDGGLLNVGQPPAPTNTAPVAEADVFTINEDNSLVVTAKGVLANDTDMQGDVLNAVLVSGPSHGTLTFDAKGNFTYTPDANYNGTDSFSYKANDGKVDSAVATVSLTVTPVNDAPVVAAHNLAMGACDIAAKVGTAALNATDVDSAALTYTVSTLGAGTLLLNGRVAGLGAHFTQADISAGRVQYLEGAVGPNGQDSVGLMLADGDGATLQTSLDVTYGSFDTVQTAAQWGGYWGGNGNDYQRGTDGADNMSGGNGCDLQIGGVGNDQLNGGEGNNRAFGQDGNDVLTGGSGNDLLDGGANDDQLHANGGANWLFGGAGNDVMTAGEGSDRAWGGDGNDTINLNGGNNRVDAGSGNDVVTTGGGDDVIIAGGGDDLVYANGGNNKFQLGGIAGAASDGNDTFYAGAGADKYALYLNAQDGSAAGWGRDVVMGFRLAEGDQLVAFNSTAGAWDDLSFLKGLTAGATPFITGARSADGGDLNLDFHAGEASSSLVLKWFFWDNASALTASEKATSFGGAIGSDDLADILLKSVQDGAVSGPDFIAKAHDYAAQDFMFV
ncbi:tandem-95 repeat protein [Roseomonas sp. GCM10028921]